MLRWLSLEKREASGVILCSALNEEKFWYPHCLVRIVHCAIAPAYFSCEDPDWLCHIMTRQFKSGRFKMELLLYGSRCVTLMPFKKKGAKHEASPKTCQGS